MDGDWLKNVWIKCMIKILVEKVLLKNLDNLFVKLQIIYF